MPEMDFTEIHLYSGFSSWGAQLQDGRVMYSWPSDTEPVRPHPHSAPLPNQVRNMDFLSVPLPE